MLNAANSMLQKGYIVCDWTPNGHTGKQKGWKGNPCISTISILTSTTCYSMHTYIHIYRIGAIKQDKASRAAVL